MIQVRLAATAAALAVGLALAGPAAAFKRLEVGQPAGDHTLTTPAGEPRQLTDVLGAGATAIAFWASWSPRSADALEGLARLRAAYGERGLAAVAVNADGPGHEPAPAAVGPEVVQLVDGDLSLYDAYGVVAVPSLVLLDAAGKVAALASGYSDSGREAFAASTRQVLGIEDLEPERPRAGDGYRPAPEAEKNLRMARLYLRRHHTEQAVDLLARALAADPGYGEARTALADALRRAGRPDAAARVELAAAGSEEYCLVPRRGAASRWQ